VWWFMGTEFGEIRMADELLSVKCREEKMQATREIHLHEKMVQEKVKEVRGIQ